MIDSSAGQEVCKMGLENLVVPESKKEIKLTAIMGYVKGAHEETKRPSSVQCENNFSKNKIILGYNPNDKISVHEPIIYLSMNLILKRCDCK